MADFLNLSYELAAKQRNSYFVLNELFVAFYTFPPEDVGCAPVANAQIRTVCFSSCYLVVSHRSDLQSIVLK